MNTNDYLLVEFPKIFKPFECTQLSRIGKNNDGGYLVNIHDVHKSDILISLGIGNDWSFEEQFSQINNCEITCFDKTTVVSPSDKFFSENRRLVSKNVDTQTSGDTISFDDILNLSDRNIFLKCDIEGDEYKFLDKIIEHSYKFVAIVIEFHQVFDDKNFNEIANFISKIDQKLIHVHANNCTSVKIGNSHYPYAIEMSFTSSNNIKYNPNLELPNDLDMKNCNWTDYKIKF